MVGYRTVKVREDVYQRLAGLADSSWGLLLDDVRWFTEIMRPVLREKEGVEVVPAEIFIRYVEKNLRDYGGVKVYAIRINRCEVRAYFKGDTNGVVWIRRGSDFDVRLLRWLGSEIFEPVRERGEYMVKPSPDGWGIEVFKVRGTEYVPAPRNYYVAFIIRREYKVMILLM